MRNLMKSLIRPADVAYELATEQVSTAVREYLRRLETHIATLEGQLLAANKKRRKANVSYQHLVHK
jgi:hypothetical protein